MPVLDRLPVQLMAGKFNVAQLFVFLAVCIICLKHDEKVSKRYKVLFCVHIYITCIAIPAFTINLPALAII